MDYKEYFNEELKKRDTQYFIFDIRESESSKYNDLEFDTYYYDLNRFKKPKPGDLFIYRRRQLKRDKRFCYYGACKIEKIEELEDNKAKVIVSKPFQFIDWIYQGDDKLESIKWRYKKRPVNSSGKKTWLHMYNRYGMTKINKEDFINLMNADKCEESTSRTKSAIELEAKYYIQMRLGDYSVNNPNKDSLISESYNRAYSRQIKENYNYQCALFGEQIKKQNLKVVRFKKGCNTLLDPLNGICLRNCFAVALKEGWISFDDDYRMIVSPALKDNDLEKYIKFSNCEGMQITMKDTSLLPDLTYIRWHREHTFKK